MGFVQKLKLRDPSGTKNAPARKAVLYVVDDATGEATPVTAGQLGGNGGDGDNSGVIAKLEQLRELSVDTNLHAQAANGNTYILASQANGPGLRIQAVPALVALSRTLLVLTAAALPLPAPPAGAVAARISVRGGSASVAAAAPLPTATDGELWGDGSVWELTAADLPGFRAVTATGSPALSITWLGALE